MRCSVPTFYVGRPTFALFQLQALVSPAAHTRKDISEVKTTAGVHFIQPLKLDATLGFTFSLGRDEAGCSGRFRTRRLLDASECPLSSSTLLLH